MNLSYRHSCSAIARAVLLECLMGRGRSVMLYSGYAMVLFHDSQKLNLCLQQAISGSLYLPSAQIPFIWRRTGWIEIPCDMSFSLAGGCGFRFLYFRRFGSTDLSTFVSCPKSLKPFLNYSLLPFSTPTSLARCL